MNEVLLVCEKLIYIVEALGITKDQIFAHTDSSVSLHWINKDKTNLKTYVSNRVAKIRQARFKSYLLPENRIHLTYAVNQNQAKNALITPFGQRGLLTYNNETTHGSKSTK